MHHARTLHPAGSRFRTVDLDAIAAGLAATACDVPLDESDSTRRYTRVLSTSVYDAWVIRWSPTAELDLHDHGGSSGLVRVVEGELVEVRADVGEETGPSARIVPAGTAITLSPTTIHGISNLASADALSVHVYAPPLSSMTFYEQRGGAYVPAHTSQSRRVLVP